MRLGSGSERRRCIMQFSLAAGSERARDKEGRDGDILCSHRAHHGQMPPSSQLPAARELGSSTTSPKVA